MLDPNRATETRHSGLGVSSFVLGLLGVLLIVVMWIWAVVSIPGSVEITYGEAAVVSALVVLGGICALVGLGLGIAGIVQRGRKKALAVTGTIISAAVVLYFVVSIIISETTGWA